LAEHGNEPQAALTAFTLGKLLVDAGGRPAEGALAFQRCLALSPPSALAEDALFRLADAEAKAGNLAAAAEAARTYGERYPDGRHMRQLQLWRGAP
jgi:TolA-binding protein